MMEICHLPIILVVGLPAISVEGKPVSSVQDIEVID
jgi:hypothetical protein